MRISEIRNPQLFQDLCQQLLVTEYPDAKIINDSRGDKGIDCYVPSTRTLYAMYCPETHPTPKEYFQRKIRTDLRKAIKIRDELGYIIDQWIFTTPTPLEEELHRYISNKATAAGFSAGANQSEKHLISLLAKHAGLRSQFPQLIIPDLERSIGEVKEGVEGLSSQISSQGSEIKSELHSIREKIEAQGDVAQKLEERTEQEYARRLERAKELADRELNITAKKAFEEIVNDLKREREFNSPSFLSRAYNEWALCELKLDNLDEAARFFEESYSYMPDDPSRISNLAMAHMLRGDTESALKTIERSLAKAPNDEFSIKRKAQILRSAKRYQDALDYLEEKNLPTVRSLFEALKNVEENRLDEAERAFRTALSLEPENVDFMHYTAESILTGRGDVISREKILPWKLPEEMRRDLDEAEELLTCVIEVHKNQEVPKKLACTLVDRASARLRLGDYEGTIRDCVEALRIEPDNTNALWNKARAEMLVPNYDDATKTWKRFVKLTDNERDGVKALINTYFLTGDIAKAKPLVLDELEREVTENDANFLDTAVVILDRNLDYDLTEKLIDRIENQFPGSALAFMIRATHLQMTGKDGAEELLRGALEVANEATRPIVVSKLANLLFEESRFEEALPLFEQLTDDREKNPVSLRRLICLCNSNRLKEALGYAAKLRGEAETDVEVSPVEAFIHRSFGNFEIAAKLYLNLYHKTGEIACLVEYGKCHNRLGEPETAVRAFDQVKSRVTRTEDLLHLANGYNTVGQAGTAMELAYKALQQDFGNPDVHLAYFKLFLDTKHHREQVEEKYKETFRDVGNKFNERFPDDERFISIKVKEKPNYVFEMLEASAVSSAEIRNDYKNNQLPISSKRFLRGRTTLEVWLALTTAKDPGFKATLPIYYEQQRERETVAKSQQVVVELLSLYTLQRINRLPILKEVFGTIFAHQSVLDELNRTIREETLRVDGGSSYAAMVEGRFVMRDIPSEMVRENIELLEAVRGFVKSDCVLSGLQIELNDLDREIIEAYSHSASYTYILAAQAGLPLLIDDGLLRIPLRNTYRVESFSTYALLAHAMDEGKLTEEEFHEALFLLLKMQYRYIPPSSALLTHGVLKNGFSAGDDFASALEEVARSEVPIPWVANIIGDFLKDLWLRSLPDTTKSLLLHAVLAKITEHHPPQEILGSMLAYLHSQMRLIPHYYMDIYGQTKRWAAVRFPEINV